MKKLLLLFAPLLLIGCYKPQVDVWDSLIIEQGNHRSEPYDLTFNGNVNIAYDWGFTESCRYEICCGDQADWNKLTGFSFNFLTNHRNSLMVAWRYNLDGYFELAPYYHKNGEVFYAEIEDNIQVVQLYYPFLFETHFTIRADIRKIFVTIIIEGTNETSFLELDMPEEENNGNTREIYPWFGGNQKAPHDIEIRRNLIERE